MYVDSFNAPFPAKLTGKTSSGGTWKYAWSEQRVVPTSGALETATEGRSGTTSVGYAVEMNNSEVATDTYVWMRVRASITGDLVYDFMAPDGTLAGGDSIAVVEEVDGSPSYTAISTLRFDSADGFVLTQPGTGIARVDIAAATASQAGVVSTTTQTIGGIKTFQSSYTICTDGADPGDGQLRLGNVSGVPVGAVTGSGTSAILTAYVSALTYFTRLEIAGVDGVAYLESQTAASTYINAAYAVKDSAGNIHTGAYASVSGLVFKGGLYISGALSIDEISQDAVGAMVADTDTINVTYTDATPELKWDVRYQMSITSDASGIKLSGDSASPGNSYFYGTNGSGTKGWYATSTISGTLDINGLTANDIDVADEIPNYDSSAAANRKITVKRLAGYQNPSLCDFRLTLSDTKAVTDSNISNSNLSWVPVGVLGGITESGYGRVALYDGTRWNLHLSATITLAMTASSGSNYDVFVYDNSGTLTLVLSSAWASDTSRTDAIELQDGVPVKASDKTRRYLGTVRASSANTVSDTDGQRYLWNMNHRRPRFMYVQETTNNWTYGSATWRSANNSTSNRVSYVVGFNNEPVDARVHCLIDTAAGIDGVVGIGVDSTSSNSAQIRMEVTNADGVSIANYRGFPGIGYHYLQWLEYSRTGTPTYIGDGGTVTIQSGLEAIVWA